MLLNFFKEIKILDLVLKRQTSELMFYGVLLFGMKWTNMVSSQP